MPRMPRTRTEWEKLLRLASLITGIVLATVLIINYTTPWIKDLIAWIKDLIECTEIQEYAASKNSEVFHYSDCSHVEKMKPENLISFMTREEAIASGRRPCKTCEP